jgi:3-methyladenine DNA glycosylase/8-oxoguanine DNA glycosylase
MLRRVIEVDEPIDVVATVRAVTPRALRSRGGSSGEVWWVGTSPTGSASLRIVAEGNRITGEAWGPGAEWALGRLGDLCGADDDVSGFAPGPGLVDQLHRRHAGLRMGRTGQVFAALLPVILGQRVTSDAARRSYRSISRAYGTMAPGPAEAWVAPSAEVVAGLDSPALHPHGVERARADVIIEAARRARRLEEAVTMAPDQAYRRLTAVRGIGPWTAGHVMGRALGDADAVPIGDYHLPNMVAWALAGEPRADDTRMLELLEPYRPHRRRVIVLLKLARITAPAFGPRRAVPDFTRS